MTGGAGAIEKKNTRKTLPESNDIATTSSSSYSRRHDCGDCPAECFKCTVLKKSEKHWRKLLQTTSIFSSMIKPSATAGTGCAKRSSTVDRSPFASLLNKIRRWMRRNHSSHADSASNINGVLTVGIAAGVDTAPLLPTPSLRSAPAFESASKGCCRTAASSSTNGGTRNLSPSSSGEDANARNKSDFNGRNRLHQPRSPLVGALSCPQSNTSHTAGIKESPCATWPTSGRQKRPTREYKCEEDDSVFYENEATGSGNQDDGRTGGSFLEEFRIPFADLQLGECLSACSRTKLYRGKWHGDVTIQTYHNLDDEQVSAFYDEISRLSRIRHENVALFMGACVELPHLAVVTSTCLGPSLYEHIHIKRQKLALPQKVMVAKQVAHGMGYLHNKKIVLKSLNSKNVILDNCNRAKISVIDFSRTCAVIVANGEEIRASHGLVPYIAPEILADCHSSNGSVGVGTIHWTAACDVYAFGTLLYELLFCRLPFSNVPPQMIKAVVCSGEQLALKHVAGPEALKDLVLLCWSHNPDDRPTFVDICKELHHRASLHKRHSSSEPKCLNKSGTNAPSLFF